MKSGLRKGFEIDYDAMRHVLILRFLGILDRGMAQQFEHRFQGDVHAIHASADRWYLLLDFTRCMPFPNDVQEIVWHAIEFARQQGMCNKAIVADGTIVGFQPTSLTGDSDMQVDFYFQSEADAIRWLLDEPVNSVTPEHTTRSVTV